MGNVGLKLLFTSVLSRQSLKKKQRTRSLSQSFRFSFGLWPMNLHYNKFPYTADAANLGTALENHYHSRVQLSHVQLFVTP